MASLRDTVREYQDDLRSGIAWLAFWREGRSWHGEAFQVPSSIMRKFIYKSGRTQSAQGRETCP